MDPSSGKRTPTCTLLPVPQPPHLKAAACELLFWDTRGPGGSPEKLTLGLVPSPVAAAVAAAAVLSHTLKLLIPSCVSSLSSSGRRHLSEPFLKTLMVLSSFLLNLSGIPNSVLYSVSEVTKRLKFLPFPQTQELWRRRRTQSRPCTLARVPSPPPSRLRRKPQILQDENADLISLVASNRYLTRRLKEQKKKGKKKKY